MTDIKKCEHYTDSEIIQKILSGETSLYELLIRRNNPYLYKVGRAYRYNHHDTEDLMQETFINAFCSLAKFQHQSSFKTWITRIMLNNCYHKKQKLSYQQEHPRLNMENSQPLFQQMQNTEKNIINRELGHVLENALHSLPEDYRLVFAMRELNGLSTMETAEALNITESNVKVRLNRTKMMLRQELEKMYSADDLFEFNLIYCDKIVNEVMHRINTKQL